ncbi:hypothetical protein NEMBOFW57_006639 [Staphylotrichum longicolle]|uniref:Uncharacterized protein n=1 Tax=Staphylotrichum longicolle TaxID=669026 RepID=A0AAD4HUM8_9PEZI|nr:hypothetical protein NEMBOFW57_006639 [Staphylotrichum longicolle]
MPLPTLLPLVQWAAVASPTLYAGITLQYSLTFYILASTTTSPTTRGTTTPNPKLLARQWLALYQLGPYWVAPLIHAGTLSNLYLAFSSRPSSSSSSSSSSNLHLLAALLTLSILPLTFLYFEPGINGACKWKAAALLRKDDHDDEQGGTAVQLLLPERKGGGVGVVVKASTVRHSASEASKRWAEREGMEGLVRAWAGRNHGRWVLGVVAGLVGFLAVRTRMMVQ